MVPLDKHSILKPFWSLRGIDFGRLDECISRGQQVTRNYVKRQHTWWNSSNLEIFQKFDNFPAEIDVKSIKIE